jgi:aspartate carbamoyltransferase regulatory subunit
MEISKYNKAMQFLLKPKYLTKDFIIQEASDAPPETSEGFANGGKVDPKTKMILDMLKRGADVDTISAITGATVEEINKIIQAPKKMSWTSDAQLDTNDNVTIETKPGFFPDMSGSTPPMNKVMPSFDGLEDPRMRQVELASGGVVQREDFGQGTKIDTYGGLTAYEMDQARIDNLNFEIEKRNKLGVKTIAPQLEKSTGYERSNINKLIQTGRVTRLLSKEELVTQYINKAIADNKTVGELTKDAIGEHINGDLPKLSKGRIEKHTTAKIIKKQFPELFKTLYTKSSGAFDQLARNTDLLDIPINDFIKDPTKIRRERSNNTNRRGQNNARLRILQGKLKLGPRDFAVSEAQDDFIVNINNAIKKDNNLVLKNPKLMELVSTTFDNTPGSPTYGQIISKARNEEKIKADIKKGFFSNEHLTPKALEKMNTEFPTNKLLIPRSTNSNLIKSSQNYLKNNRNDKNAIQALEGLTNKFNININTENGKIGPKQGSTVEGNKLLSYENQLKTIGFNSPDVNFNIVKDIPKEELQKTKVSMKEQVNRFKDILNPQEIKAINQSLNSGFNPMEFGRLFPNEAKIVKSAMSKIGRVALALELPLELAVESAFMANAIAGGDTFREAWADSLIGHLDPTLYKDGMFTGPKISGDDLKNLKLDISQSARTNIELEKSDETLQSLKDELESGLSMLNLEGVDEATTSEDYNSLRERIRNEQYRNDKLREGTSEASKLELANAKTEFESGRSANSFSTRVAKFASDLENMTDASGLNYDLRKGKNEDREVKKRNFDTVEDQANFFINNFPDIKQSYEKNKDLFATPAEFYSAIREQNPKFNEKVIEFMMNPEYADEGTRGLDFSTRAVDQTPKVIDDVIDTYATGERVGLSGGGRGGWIAKRIQEINKLIKSKKAGPEDFFDEVQLLEKAKELNLNEGQVSQILKQQQQQRIDNYKKLPIQGDPALNSRLPYDSDTTPRNYKKVKTTSLEGSKADYGTYKFTGQESMDDLYELERQGKLTREDMNVYDPRYMEYLDAQIINKEQLYTRKEWENTPEVLKNKTRGRIDPDWEIANFGEDFDWDQARSIEIDQTQKLKNFDTSGRTKQASGGRIGLNIDDIMNNYATGGRVGFEKGGKPPKDNPIIPVNPMMDEGPQDPGKRTFLKGMGAVGLGAAAIGTGIIKIGKALKTKTALNVLANPAVGQPAWFAPLVDKILLKGSIKKIDDFAKNVDTSTPYPNKPITTTQLKPVYNKTKNTVEQLTKVARDLNIYELEEAGKKFTLTKKPDGSIFIEVKGGGAYDDSFTLSHTRYNVTDIETGKIKEIREFQASETRPEYHSMGGDEHGVDYALELTKDEVFIGEEVFKLQKNGTGFLSDLEGVEKIATGKIKDPKLAKTRTKVRNKLKEDPYKDRSIDDYDYQLDQDIGHDYID